MVQPRDSSKAPFKPSGAGSSSAAEAPKPKAPAKKSNAAIAAEVKAGKWGNGPDRVSRLTRAGYNATAVQSIVNGGSSASAPRPSAAPSAAAKAAAASVAALVKSTAAKVTTAAQGEVASSFGYSLAFFNSNPELKSLLAKATAGGYSSARFVSELQNTKWFRTNNEAQRKYATLKATDPATYKQQLYSNAASVQRLGTAMGAPLSTSQMNDIADKAMRYGWGDDQIKNVLAGMLKTTTDSRYTSGEAAAYQQQFNSIAKDYGVSISNDSMKAYIKQAVLGGQTAEGFSNAMKAQAISKYVGLKDRLMGGETVRQIADPYLQSYGKLLEVGSNNISLDDPLIQRALMAKDAKGKPTTQTVWDFENTLRKDPRWNKTDNAQDNMSSTAADVLKTFGLV